MAAAKKKAVTGHEETSNLGSEASVKIMKSVFKAPSEGINPKTVKPNADGSEALAGHKKNEMSALTEIIIPKDLILRDIGEASFGPPVTSFMTETVHGADNRIKITATASYPWRVHCSLLITARDNSQWIGTGWFIGPHTVMTAGHCVYIKNSGVAGRDGWVRSIKVMPGRNGAALPYGSVTSTNFKSVTGWTNDGSENFDYGAIILPTNKGNETGWFGFGVYSDAELISSTGNISGYPGDKPSGTQWYDAHRIASVNSRKVYYDIDTYGGQSGAAVYRIKNGGRYAFAIHAYGGGSTNSGTRIVTPVYNNMINWKA